MYALCSSFGIFSLPGGEKFATAAAIFTTSIIMAIALGIFGKIVLGNKNN